MVISPTVFTPCEAAEAIQVKLSLEGRELGLAEVLGHDNRDKLLGLVHEKGTPVRLPGNDTSQTVGFNSIQHFV